MRSLAMLFVLAIAMVGLAGPAQAQEPGFEVQVNVVGHTGIVKGSPSENVLSFSGPVGIPGVGLAPGGYIFRLIAPSVMQVLSENRSMVYASFFVTPIRRNEVTSDYAVTLRRFLDDAPARITALFPPHASSGYELTYPKSEVWAEKFAMK